jgi:hypothetical protein
MRRAILIGSKKQNDGKQIEKNFHCGAVVTASRREGRRAFCYDSRHGLNLDAS